MIRSKYRCFSFSLFSCNNNNFLVDSIVAEIWNNETIIARSDDKVQYLQRNKSRLDQITITIVYRVEKIMQV